MGESDIEALAPWYHTITLADGSETPGRGANIRHKFEQISAYLPDDLDGACVLDVGCNAGGVLLEFAKRGAVCTGVELLEHYARQAEYCVGDLGLEDRCRIVRGDAYSLIRDHGEYDFVVCLGLIYHLRYPQLALDLIAERCVGRAFLSTPTVQPATEPVAELRIPSDARPHRLGEYPAFNLWYLSIESIARMMRLAGFAEIATVWQRDDPFVSSSPHVDNDTFLATGQAVVTGVRDAAFTPTAASELWAYDDPTPP